MNVEKLRREMGNKTWETEMKDWRRAGECKMRTNGRGQKSWTSGRSAQRFRGWDVCTMRGKVLKEDTRWIGFVFFFWEYGNGLVAKEL